MLLKKKSYGYFDMVSMSAKVSPFYSFIYAAKDIIGGLIPTFSIFSTADFINSALKVYNGEADISAVYKPVAMLGAIMVYNSLINIFMSLISCRQTIYYRKKLSPEMLKKLASLEYQHIENPKTADLINRVVPNYDKNVRDMYSRVMSVVNLVIYLMGIFISLYTQVWWIAVSMFITSIPLLYVATAAGKKGYEADKEMTKIDRRVKYLSGVLKSREAFEERGMFGYTESLNSNYSERYEYARKFRLKVSLKYFIRNKAGGIVTSAYSIGAMLAMLNPVARGDISFGMFIALMSAVFGLSQRLSWGVNNIVEDLSRKREYLRDLTEFVQLSENADAIAAPEKNVTFKTLEFKNVSFKYPGMDKLILDNVSFTIENGRHYSFVGVNGAGKTTMTKLITGLYTNYEGEILVDGKSLREFSQSWIKGLSSVVYQDFAKYYISLYDNIAVADPDTDNPNIGGNVEKAAELVGLAEAVKKLPQGLDTPLGKILEKGADLSGGEWQRAAMARSVMSRAPLKILDEPTAALDPVGESMVYKNFEKISRGTTTIFISHRLGSTKLADTIFVISGGKITEKGSHAELMGAKGEYFEMFNSQAEWYKSGKEAEQ